MNVLNLIFGAVLLFLGRKFYWLFVGIVGFIVGFNLANRFLADQADWLQILVAVIAGLIGAGLALLLQRVAIAIAGFFAGGNFLSGVLVTLGVQQAGDTNWIAFVIGGILGAFLVLLLFDWALILLSSLTGANLIIQALALTGPTGIIVLVVLALVGIFVQAGLWQREQRAAARLKPDA